MSMSVGALASTWPAPFCQHQEARIPGDEGSHLRRPVLLGAGPAPAQEK